MSHLRNTLLLITAGGRGRARIIDWLDRPSLDDIPGGRFEEGGVWGYTLCESCNSRTGRLSHPYRRVASAAARLFIEELPPVDDLNAERVTRLVRWQIQLHPGAFARQVMSLMFSLAGPWDVASRYPELRGAVLGGTRCAMPDALSLGMLLCAGPHALTAGPSLHLEPAEGRWRWIVVLAHPPLAFELELARSDATPSSVACDIGGFLDVDEQMKAIAELDVPIGFTNTAFPGDWRTRTQIESGLDLCGRPPEVDGRAAKSDASRSETTGL